MTSTEWLPPCTGPDDFGRSQHNRHHDHTELTESQQEFSLESINEQRIPIQGQSQGVNLNSDSREQMSGTALHSDDAVFVEPSPVISEDNEQLQCTALNSYSFHVSANSDNIHSGSNRNHDLSNEQTCDGESLCHNEFHNKGLRLPVNDCSPEQTPSCLDQNTVVGGRWSENSLSFLYMKQNPRSPSINPTSQIVSSDYAATERQKYMYPDNDDTPISFQAHDVTFLSRPSSLNPHIESQACHSMAVHPSIQAHEGKLPDRCTTGAVPQPFQYVPLPSAYGRKYPTIPSRSQLGDISKMGMAGLVDRRSLSHSPEDINPSHFESIPLVDSPDSEPDKITLDIAQKITREIAQGIAGKHQAKIAEYEAERGSLQSELEQERAENRGLKAQVDRLQHEKDNLATMIGEQKAEIAGFASKANRLKAFMDGLGNDIDNLRRNAHGTQSKIQDLIDDSKEQGEVRDSISQQISECVERFSQFKNEALRAGREANTELAAAETQCTRLQHELDSKSKLLAEEKALRMQSQNQREAAGNMNEAVLQQLRSDKEAVLKRLYDIQEAIEQSEDRHIVVKTVEKVLEAVQSLDLHSTSTQVTAYIDEALQSLKADVQNLRNFNAQETVTQRQLAALEEKLNISEGRVQEITAQLEVARTEEAKLKEQICEYQAANNEMNDLVAANARLDAHAKSLGEQINELQAVDTTWREENIDLLKKVLEAEQKARQETSTAAAKFQEDRQSTWENERKALTHEQTRLSSKLEHLQAKLASDDCCLRNMKAQHEEQLRLQISTISELQERLNASNQANKTTEEIANAAEQKANDFKQAAERAEQHVVERIDLCKAQADYSIQVEKEEASKTIQELQRQISEQQTSMKVRLDKREKLHADDQENWQKERKQLEDELVNLEAQVAEFSAFHEDSKRTIEAMRAELMAKNAQIVDFTRMRECPQGELLRSNQRSGNLTNNGSGLGGAPEHRLILAPGNDIGEPASILPDQYDSDEERPKPTAEHEPFNAFEQSRRQYAGLQKGLDGDLESQISGRSICTPDLSQSSENNGVASSIGFRPLSGPVIVQSPQDNLQLQNKDRRQAELSHGSIVEESQAASIYVPETHSSSFADSKAHFAKADKADNSRAAVIPHSISQRESCDNLPSFAAFNCGRSSLPRPSLSCFESETSIGSVAEAPTRPDSGAQSSGFAAFADSPKSEPSNKSSKAVPNSSSKRDRSSFNVSQSSGQSNRPVFKSPNMGKLNLKYKTPEPRSSLAQAGGLGSQTSDVPSRNRSPNSIGKPRARQRIDTNDGPRLLRERRRPGQQSELAKEQVPTSQILSKRKTSDQTIDGLEHQCRKRLISRETATTTSSAATGTPLKPQAAQSKMAPPRSQLARGASASSQPHWHMRSLAGGVAPRMRDDKKQKTKQDEIHTRFTMELRKGTC